MKARRIRWRIVSERKEGGNVLEKNKVGRRYMRRRRYDGEVKGWDG